MSEILNVKRISLATCAFVLLGAVAASAADLGVKRAPVYKAAVAPVSVYNWTGLYIGAYAGVGVNRSHIDDPRVAGLGGVVRLTGSGFTGGGTLGYNLQFWGSWVAGVEGDFGALDLKHRAQEYNEANLVYDSKTSTIGTLRARLGFSDGPTLTYVTGGGAWVNVEDINSNFAGSAVVSSSKTLSGSVYGTGTETMLGGNWTAKAEYLTVDVGSGDTLSNAVNGFTIQADKHRYHLMKYGVNYRLGGSQGPLPQTNWTGLYVGIVGGSAVAQVRAADPRAAGVGGQLGANDSGLTIGGQLGYNWQFMPAWVVGIEGDWSWLGIDKSRTNFNDPTAVFGLKTNSIATARGRIGYSTGPALLYVTGGGAWVDVTDNWSFATPGSTSKTLSGTTVGGGIENTFNLFGLLGPNWTTKTEYLYVDVGNLDVPAIGTSPPLTVSHKFHLFRSALSYRFGGGPVAPVVAKY